MNGGCRALHKLPAVAKAQSAAETEGWKLKARKKALRRRLSAKKRHQRSQISSPLVDDQRELPSDALRWRGQSWKQHRAELKHLQQGIYKAMQAGDWTLAETLQSALLNSEAAKSLAVRRVTTTHPQRRVAGVDGEHSLDGERQQALRNSLTIDGHADEFEFRLVPRAWKELRQKRDADDLMEEEGETVCVCTMKDRARQVLLLWALEPQLESLFSSSDVLSHRPGRTVKDLLQWLVSGFGLSTHVTMIQLTIESPETVSRFLASILQPVIAEQLESWICRGLFQTGMYPAGIGRHGEEQSCPILPLLSNLLCHHLLDVMQSRLKDVKAAAWNGSLIAVASSPEGLSSSQQLLQKKADSIGLKGQISLPIADISEKWITFQEFSMRQRASSSGECTLTILPRDGILQQHLHNLTTAVKMSRIFHEDKSGLINRLNPIIQSFTHHFALTNGIEQFEEADTHLRSLLITWALEENTTLELEEALEKEFHGTLHRDLGFEFKTRIVRLLRHGDPLRQNHLPLVTKEKSPYDEDRAYWKQRLRHWDYNLTPSFL